VRPRCSLLAFYFCRLYLGFKIHKSFVYLWKLSWGSKRITKFCWCFAFGLLSWGHLIFSNTVLMICLHWHHYMRT